MLRTVVSLLLLSVWSVSAITPCHICGDKGNGAMSHPNVILANVGKSCTQIALDVSLSVPFGSNQCRAKQNEWKGRCCSGNRPAGKDPDKGLPAQNIPSVQHVGPYPVCNICRDGDYPFATSMVINFLYIGEGSCAQYYKYGKEGRIQTHMCDPVKFFSYEPCGCGQFNPYFNPNHPLNQQAQQSPGSNGNSGGNSGGNSNSNGGGNNGQPQQQRIPDQASAKACMKMSNSQGGSGACAHSGGRKTRALKGSSSSSKPVQDSEVAVVL